MRGHLDCRPSSLSTLELHCDGSRRGQGLPVWQLLGPTLYGWWEGCSERQVGVELSLWLSLWGLVSP